MDRPMNSLSTRAVMGAAAALAFIGLVTTGSSPVSAMVVSMALAIVALVAFATQSIRLRDEERLVYRPVYVRRHNVQRRVRSYHD